VMADHVVEHYRDWWSELVSWSIPFSPISPRPVFFFFFLFRSKVSVQVFCLPIVQMIVHW
jgi:hypothetical protein